MYGLFIYIRWKMATFKGKWLGKYSLHGAFGISNLINLGCSNRNEQMSIAFWMNIFFPILIFWSEQKVATRWGVGEHQAVLGTSIRWSPYALSSSLLWVDRGIWRMWAPLRVERLERPGVFPRSRVATSQFYIIHSTDWYRMRLVPCKAMPGLESSTSGSFWYT